MNTETLDIGPVIFGGEKKGEPGGHGVLFPDLQVEKGWFMFPTAGAKRPWGVQRYTKDLLRNGKFHRNGGISYFKTETKAKEALFNRVRAENKVQEQLTGPFSEGSSSPAQQELIRARTKMIRKWFPDTTALHKQIELTGRTEEHALALRKALAIDMARLKRPVAPEILAGVLFDPDFTAVFAKAQTSSNPLDPMEEELALNWVAKYSGEGDGSYPSTMKEVTGTCYTSSAIKKRAQRLGLTVSSSKKSGQIT
jgi:hypothetical protein